MKFLFNFLFLIVTTVSYSQNEFNKWYFGNKAAIDFTGQTPVSITTSSMTATEGCSSLSDGAGNLLFYTNGVQIWNKNNNIMANGSFLGGNVSASQSVFAVKKPGSSHLYYLFTLNSNVTPGVLAYSIVDMNLAAGLGSVTVVNNTLTAQLTEKLTGTMHCNGTDIWIIAHKYNTNEFVAYLLTAGGVATTPVISAQGHVHVPNNISGTLKISPNGKKIGQSFAESIGKLELADFDNATGIVSNAFILATYSLEVSPCEFSPDGTKFYSVYYEPNPAFVIVTGHIMQWDLSAGSNSAISASQLLVGTTYSVSVNGMQLASNGKIYVAMIGKNYIGVIDKPNVSGLACSYSSSVISLGTALCFSDLPNYMATHFREKPVFTTTVNCASASFSLPVFYASVGYSLTGQSWIFGDPASGAANSSSLSSPSHIYSNAGTYTAQLILNYDCNSDTLKQIVNIAIPAINVVGKTTICAKESTTLSVSGANTYTWSSGLNTPTVSFTPSITTVYTVSGTFTNTLCDNKKVVTVSVVPCTGIYEAHETEKLIVLYPNPNKGVFTLESLEPNTQVTIYNQLGSKVYEIILSNSKQKIDVSDLPTGVYFIMALSNGELASTKFVKIE